MKSFLFDAVGRGCVLICTISDTIANLLVLGIVKLSSLFKVNFAHVCMWLLTRIDSKRVADEKLETEELKQSLELALMQAAVRIKDSAKEDDDWTEEHSEALNMVGIRLIEECNWDPVQVHKYFKPIVESIEGLEYGN